LKFLPEKFLACPNFEQMTSGFFSCYSRLLAIHERFEKIIRKAIAFSKSRY